MGQIQPPLPVLPLLAVTSRYDEAFAWAESRFAELFGPLQLASPRFVFDQTDYYTSSMGTSLHKQFFAPQRLDDPGRLGEWKRMTNEWEDLFGAEYTTSTQRPLNLDPGYISQDKLVLASTKNHAHRIYLSNGIYAEVTLQYRARRWQTCPWTYPDYGQAEFHAFFDQCREHLRGQLRGGSSPDGAGPTCGH